MLKNLLLIVFSFSFLMAKEMPITQTMEIVIPYREFSILEFPFNIKDLKFAPFESKKIIKKSKKEDDILDKKLSMPKLSKKPNTNINALPPSIKSLKQRKNPINFFDKKPKPIQITKGKRYLQFYPLKAGKTELTVWGYKYPLLIKLIVAEQGVEANKYIKFLDYDNEFEKQNDEFKRNSHEKICTKLIYYLYNNKIPKGFKVTSPYSINSDKNLKYVLVRSIQGKQYSGNEYHITNISGKNLNLLEPMFASKDTYAVAIENRHLKSGESTKLFIVSPANKDR